MTPNRKHLICNAAMDIESGNYLLRKRTMQQIGIINQLNRILYLIGYSKKLNTKQKKIYHEYLMDSNYDYAMKHKVNVFKN